jgi:hypothetical protein
MLVALACLLAACSPLLLGRSLAPLAGLLLRGLGLIWGALLAQVVLVYAPLPRAGAVALHLTTYAVAVAVIWINRSLPGLAIVGLGAAANGVTIALNGGMLPARLGALEAAGFAPERAFANSGVVTDPVLPWLGDVFAWPAPLPLANVFSVGDVLIVLGVGWGSHRLAARARRASTSGSDSAQLVAAGGSSSW